MGTAMKPTRMITALIFAVLALPTKAVGQEQISTEVAVDDQAVEASVVAVQRSTADLRHDLWQTEDDSHTPYNKLNDDNLYDVRCSYEAPIGSRIKTHVCRPAFLLRALSRGEINRMTNLEKNPAIVEKMARFREKPGPLIAANPELQAAADAFTTARALYMAQSESKAGN